MAPAGNMSVLKLMTSCGLSGEDPGLWPLLFLEPLPLPLDELASPFPGGVPSPGAILMMLLDGGSIPFLQENGGSWVIVVDKAEECRDASCGLQKLTHSLM